MNSRVSFWSMVVQRMQRCLLTVVLREPALDISHLEQSLEGNFEVLQRLASGLCCLVSLFGTSPGFCGSLFLSEDSPIPAKTYPITAPTIVPTFSCDTLSSSARITTAGISKQTPTN